jgi:hypothetical protein
MEARRSVRVASRFLAAIDGLDAETLPRSGDISATGIYFETAHEVGPIGTIHWLRLVSMDGTRRVGVMAYVVRRVLVLRAEGSPIHGVAFEFMPESDDATAALADLVRHVHRPASEAPPRQLAVRSLVLETNWRVDLGERVRIDVVAPGMTERIRLEGRAVRVAPQPESSRFTIVVEVREQTAAPLRKESMLQMQAVRPESMPPPMADDDVIAERLHELLSGLIVPERDPTKARRHNALSGMIARIPLPTLISLFELERMSGRLRVRRAGEESTLYVSHGRIIDVEPRGEGTARQRIAELLSWDDGSFEFSLEPIDREDRVEVSSTALLLDIARESDEANR